MSGGFMDDMEITTDEVMAIAEQLASAPEFVPLKARIEETDDGGICVIGGTKGQKALHTKLMDAIEAQVCAAEARKTGRLH